MACRVRSGVAGTTIAHWTDYSEGKESRVVIHNDRNGEKGLRLGIVGFGKVGRACADAVLEGKELTLAAIVRRFDHAAQPLPERFSQVPVVSHTAQVPGMDGALLCVPAAQVFDAAHGCLQHGVPIVESSILHGEAFQAHREAIDRLAMRFHVPAIVGAGWDPGALSVLRSLFGLLVPDGELETTHRVAASLHHTAMARQVTGVKEALCTEQVTAGGMKQRYVYVEVEPGVDVAHVAAAIRADPLFLREETLVFPVDSVAALEQEGRGVVLERRSGPGSRGHQRLLFEARFDDVLMTARIMVAAARALPSLSPGAHALLDLPLGTLWGEREFDAERTWL